MRVLVVAGTPDWTPGNRLMATLAAGLSARGEMVALACASRSPSEAAIERTWPRLVARSITGTGWFRKGVSLRGIMTALRPDAVLVGSAADAALAAFVMGGRRGIVRRLAVEECGTSAREADALPWRARFMLSRAKIVRWGEEAPAVSWPLSSLAAAAPEPDVHPLPVAPPCLVVVPALPHDDRTAAALRAAAHLRSRHPDLQLALVGDVAQLQAVRLHAASLNLTACVHIVPLDALLHHELHHELHRGLGHASAVWVAQDGDAGAIAALAAMQQGVPVVVPDASSLAGLVAPTITGFLAADDGGSTVVAELARLLADGDAQRMMGRAAAARAAREFGWDAFVDTAASLLAEASGVSTPRITRRPSLSPA